MVERVKRRRPYRSAVRAEQAQRTRARILEAARALFLERGFSATTIAGVAHAAGVAPETVYATYRSKAGLLEAVVLAAVLRDDERDEALERRWVREALELPDLRAQIGALARHTAETVKLTSPIYAVIRAAGADVSELNELQRRLQDYRFSGQAKFIATIAAGPKSATPAGSSERPWRPCSKAERPRPSARRRSLIDLLGKRWWPRLW